MSATWGRALKLTLFGESHGLAIGAVIDGLPPGIPIDQDAIAHDLARRAPGQAGTTARKEADAPIFQSGIYRGRTTGTPLCFTIENGGAHADGYAAFADHPRPGHADYTAHIRYRGHNDPRGGGHTSGRLTAPLVLAGAIARGWLRERGVDVAAHISLLSPDLRDVPFPLSPTPGQLDRLRRSAFPTIDDDVAARMLRAIEEARAAGDSLGAIVECAAAGTPAG